MEDQLRKEYEKKANNFNYQNNNQNNGNIPNPNKMSKGIKVFNGGI